MSELEQRLIALGRALDVPEGAPLMLVERIAYTADGTPVEFARDRHRGDRARFELRVRPDEMLARER